MLEAGRSELGIFRRIFWKCRVGYRDKTLKVIGRLLGRYLSPALTESGSKVHLCGFSNTRFNYKYNEYYMSSKNYYNYSVPGT